MTSFSPLLKTDHNCFIELRMQKQEFQQKLFHNNPTCVSRILPLLPSLVHLYFRPSTADTDWLLSIFFSDLFDGESISSLKRFLLTFVTSVRQEKQEKIRLQGKAEEKKKTKKKKYKVNFARPLGIGAIYQHGKTTFQRLQSFEKLFFRLLEHVLL